MSILFVNYIPCICEEHVCIRELEDVHIRLYILTCHFLDHRHERSSIIAVGEIDDILQVVPLRQEKLCQLHFSSPAIFIAHRIGIVQIGEQLVHIAYSGAHPSGLGFEKALCRSILFLVLFKLFASLIEFCLPFLDTLFTVFDLFVILLELCRKSALGIVQFLFAFG